MHKSGVYVGLPNILYPRYAAGYIFQNKILILIILEITKGTKYIGLRKHPKDVE